MNMNGIGKNTLMTRDINKSGKNKEKREKNKNQGMNMNGTGKNMLIATEKSNVEKY